MIPHTPEPWRHGVNAMIVADGLPVADCAPDLCEDDTPEPNARRIVACVNACRGIPTEVLEKSTWAMLGRCAIIHSGRLSDEDKHRLANAKPGEVVCVSPGAGIKIEY